MGIVSNPIVQTGACLLAMRTGLIFFHSFLLSVVTALKFSMSFSIHDNSVEITECFSHVFVSVKVNVAFLI